MKKIFVLMLSLVLALPALSACGGEEGINHLVIEVGFGEGADTGDAGEICDRFFFEESLGRLKIKTLTVAVTSDKPASYYMRGGEAGWNEDTVDGKPHIDCFYREQTLVREALSKAVPLAQKALKGVRKCYLTLALGISADDESERIICPHSSELREFSEIENIFYIPENYLEPSALEMPRDCGVEWSGYSIINASPYAGVMCHELTHQLGLSDYYAYGPLLPNYDRLGGYELMGMKTADIPQYSLAYLRFKLGFLREGEDILVAAKSANYTLQPVTEGGVQAIKILPADFLEKGEFFYLEAREKREGEFDCGVNASGVIAYSVVPENAYISQSGDFSAVDRGNMYGAPEVALLPTGPAGLFNYLDGKEGKSSLSLKYRDGSEAGVTVNVSRSAGGWDISVELSSSPEPSAPHTVKIAGGCITALAFSGGSCNAAVIRADGMAVAAGAMGVLPKPSGAKKYYDFLFETALQEGGLFVPAASDCAVVAEWNGGKISFFPAETRAEEPSFNDFAAVMFLPGNAAFIAVLSFAVLCVLAGFAALLFKRKRKKRADNR